MKNKQIYSEPDFLIIGAMKSGTTSLFHYLSKHKNIIPPEYKEPAFFAWHYDKGYDWYLSKFPTKDEKNGKLTFEATPLYLYMKDSPKRIKEYLPNVKLIAILRDPVKRAFSHWKFYHDSDYVNETDYRLINLKDNRTFSEVVSDELNGSIRSDAHTYLKNGYYFEQFKRYYKYFDPSDILVLDFNDLESNLSRFMQKICNFLEIDNDFGDVTYNNIEKKFIAVANRSQKSESSLKTFAKFNTNKSGHTLSKSLYEELKAHFKVKNEGLNELLEMDFSWNL